ncbi:MAG: hypothetical protein DRP74_09165 [Candidatus Omnitrophota bacterium]|nr:MAG: hypothetical protein DRP74_09165 [Candidatus Omnitrophota bacterium]
MAEVTQGLKPERLWHYFEEIAKIPRASKNEREILAYIRRFAENRKLDYAQDAAGNIVIRREASPRFKDRPVIVLQSHVDMVCEKNENSSHDFETDPITLVLDDEWVKADGTSLGADNGIGIAAMLALLEDREDEFGRIECLFTVDEETGLTGAFNLDPSLIQGRLLVNLDTESSTTLYIGCAGGKDSDILLPVAKVFTDGGMKSLRIAVRGLKGGHSGVEIHLGRANAIKLLARILNHLKLSYEFHVVSVTGGDKANAIPREAEAVIIVRPKDSTRVMEEFRLYSNTVLSEYERIEPGARFECEECEDSGAALDRNSTDILIRLLMAIPHGVIAMSAAVRDLVETSTNLSSVRTEERQVHIHTSHRSSIESALEWVVDTHVAIASLASAQCRQDEGYPAWYPDPDSQLLAKVKKAYRKVTGRDAHIKAIHAGLECGVIKKKFEGMDAVSVGPTIENAHSPDERVNIKSVEIFDAVLRETLREVYG